MNDDTIYAFVLYDNVGPRRVFFDLISLRQFACKNPGNYSEGTIEIDKKSLQEEILNRLWGE